MCIFIEFGEGIKQSFPTNRYLQVSRLHQIRLRGTPKTSVQIQ